MADLNSAAVLIVNGDEVNRGTLAGYLRRGGWRVWEAETGEKGLELAKQAPEVILLDVSLVDLNAREFSQRLRSQTATRTIPLLYTSGGQTNALPGSFAPNGEADAYLAAPIDFDELVATVRVLSRLRIAEARLDTSSSQWSAVLEGLAEGVIVADRDGRFLTMNSAALRIHGFDSGQTLPIMADDQERLLEYSSLEGTVVPREQWPVMRAVRGESIRHLEIRVRRRDTGKVWIGLYNARLVEGQGSETGAVIVTFSDITDKKETEKALAEAQRRLSSSAAELEQTVNERTSALREAISQMEEFSYTVSHDLRAPLRSIKGYAEILVEDHGSRMKREGLQYLERIVENGERMERLVNDVLTISRISNTKVKLVRVTTRSILEAVVREHVNLQPRAAHVVIEPLPDVLGQESLCIQVFSNLLSNAVKFVNSGSPPKIHVWADQIGDRVRINVKDNGIGISPEHHQKIFGMFERLDPNNRYGGTGIGLAIVRRAVEKMNGRVGVESDGHSGSRFWVELPAWTGEK